MAYFDMLACKVKDRQARDLTVERFVPFLDENEHENRGCCPPFSGQSSCCNPCGCGFVCIDGKGSGGGIGFGGGNGFGGGSGCGGGCGSGRRIGGGSGGGCGCGGGNGGCCGGFGGCCGGGCESGWEGCCDGCSGCCGGGCGNGFGGGCGSGMLNFGSSNNICCCCKPCVCFPRSFNNCKDKNSHGPCYSKKPDYRYSIKF